MKLTKPQQLIYEMDRFIGGSIANICGSMLLDGKISKNELIRNVQEIYRINEALRIRILEVNGQPQQSVVPYEEKEVECLYFQNKSELDKYAEEYAKEPMNIYEDLCYIKIVLLENKYGIIAKLHHIIADAWSLALLCSQLKKLLNKEHLTAYSYSDYIISEEKYLNSKRHGIDRGFFLNQFKMCDEITYLCDKQSSGLKSARKSYLLDKEITMQINNYAIEKGVSVFTVFMTVMALYFNRTKMNLEKFYIGTAVLNRSGEKERNTIGMFINTVPILIELNNEETFEHNLYAIEESLLSVFRHQKFHYGDTLKAIRKEYNFGEPLYDVMLSYQNAKITGNQKTESTWYTCGEQKESLQIHIDDRDGEGNFHIHYDYLVEKFTDIEIKQFHEHVLSILKDAMNHTNKKIYEIQMMNDSENQKILYDFNATKTDYPKNKCIHQLFEEQIVKIPDKISVVACDETLTYKQLNEQANCIAHGLIEKGIKIGDIVAIKLTRKSYLFSAMIAVLKTGAVYMPLAPDYPPERIQYMLKESNAAYCISEENIRELLNNKNAENCNIFLSSDAHFCALHTSGSTGNPKLTMLTHRNIVNFYYANKRFWNGIDTVVSATIVTFDAFVVDSILSVVQGCQVILADEEEIYNQDKFERLFCYSDKIMLFSTPTKIEKYIDNSSSKKFLENIKSYVVGGEVFPESLLEKITYFSKECTVYNGYGPTETTQCVTLSELNTHDEITIGKPIANTQIYILDQFLQPVPIGVTGELCIAGDGVGAGYLNQPQLTAEKFVNNPFGKGKMYRTGDLAYWKKDGNIVYVGRNDFQVKVRGLRIELGEIESAIREVDGVEHTVVVVRKNKANRQFICAFYTGQEIEAKEFREKLEKKLPKYMLPHIFTHIESMPLTLNGKIDRKVLPEISLEDFQNHVNYVAPQTQQQKILCQIMENVLNISPIGLHDDFFEMGADSLKIIEFLSKAHQEGIYINTQKVFDYPTIGLLTDNIERESQNHMDYQEKDFYKINKVLTKNQGTISIVPREVQSDTLFLTGATGYLGIHLLAEFLNNHEGTVFCLVRGKDIEDSTRRLNETLEYYFGNRYINASYSRINVVCGDLTKEYFGVSKDEYLHLLSKVTTVINAAASVKHYGSYEYFKETNVDTVKNLISFCRKAKARFLHTSTLSVSGLGLSEEKKTLHKTEKVSFDESKLYVGQSLDNVYVRSKFEAEKIILEEISNGLHASIMRIGNLTNRRDGLFQKNFESNAFLQKIRAFLDLRMFPDYLENMEIEFTSVEEAAKAIIIISKYFHEEQTVFHINNSNAISLKHVFELFKENGFIVEKVDETIFSEALQQTIKNPQKQYIYDAFITDMNNNKQINYESDILIQNQYTADYLEKLGFKWSYVDSEYIRNYVEYFVKIGFLHKTDKNMEE